MIAHDAPPCAAAPAARASACRSSVTPVALLERGHRSAIGVTPATSSLASTRAVDRLRAPSARCDSGRCKVAADADEPGLKIRAAVERVERLEDLQEDVLREILGFVVLADELVARR